MKSKNISYVILAICVLHNFLRRKYNTYTSLTSMDREDTDMHVIHPGDWRNNTVELVGLHQVNTRNTTIQAKINRDNYKSYFNSEERVQ